LSPAVLDEQGHPLTADTGWRNQFCASGCSRFWAVSWVLGVQQDAGGNGRDRCRALRCLFV